MAALKGRRAEFVRQYLIDLNATKAYIRAGYAPKNADVNGPALMGNYGVAEAIARGMARRAERTEITADRVLQELALVAFANIEDVTKVNGPDRVPRLSMVAREHLAAVAEIIIEDDVVGHGDNAVPVRRTRLKMHNKLSALHQLGEHLGLYNRKLELTGKVTLEQLVAESYKPREDGH